MPRMNGYELTAKIREMPKFRDIPIVFLTSYATREQVSRAFMHGGNDYMVKPVDKRTLVHKVERQLGLKENGGLYYGN